MKTHRRCCRILVRGGLSVWLVALTVNLLISGMFAMTAMAAEEEMEPAQLEETETPAAAPEKPGPFEYPGMIMHVVHVADTDPDLSNDHRAHLAYVEPDIKPRGQLLVYFPGTHDTAKEGGWVNSVAAHQGYHVLSLTYRSGIGLAIFRKSDDPQAFQKGRDNLIYGAAPIGPLQVDRAESIVNRIVKALIYLNKTYPKEGWGAYLNADKNEPLWQKLCLAGLSQGGGHACLMGIQHPVARVVMFASPKDFSLHFHKPALWYSLPSKTPKTCFFCFVHSLDEGHGCSYKQQVENYRALGLYPRFPIVDVESSPPPYDHTRLLTAHQPADVPKHNHGVVIGRPQYGQVWAYMLTEPCP